MTLIHFGEGSNGLSTCNVLCIYESSIVNNGSIYDSEWTIEGVEIKYGDIDKDMYDNVCNRVIQSYHLFFCLSTLLSNQQ